MIVLGDISGIQSYLFDAAEAGGGQARRLRVGPKPTGPQEGSIRARSCDP